MVATADLLHLTSCQQATTVVEETLRRLGRSDSVVGMRDIFNEGPLHDIDMGGASRIEWWTRIHGEAVVKDVDGEIFDDSDLWDDVRARSSDVVLWHGPHPMERIFELRASWHLRDQPERVHEVVLVPSGKTWSSRPRPAFYDCVPLAGPDETTNAWSRRVRVPDVAVRAKQWEELRSVPGDWIRVLNGDDVVLLPVTAYDGDLVNACGADWTASSKVLGLVLGNNPTSLSLLQWRIRDLLQARVLEGRGEENQLGLPTEVRPVPAR
jgi:hypothetical protein